MPPPTLALTAAGEVHTGRRGDGEREWRGGRRTSVRRVRPLCFRDAVRSPICRFLTGFAIGKPIHPVYVCVCVCAHACLVT